MSKIKLNPECWNCGANTNDDRVCPKCGEHLEDNPETIEFKDYTPILTSIGVVYVFNFFNQIY